MTVPTLRDEGGRQARPQARPRFELVTGHAPRVVAQRVGRALHRSRAVVGMAIPARLELTVPQEATHLWSPQLIVDVTESEGGSRLEARFAPHPHVWTMYVGACVIACMATFGALMLAVAQWMMNDRLWGLWVAPGTALVAALTFGAAFVGQGLSAPQMFLLREFLRDALEAPEFDSGPEAQSYAPPD